MTRPVDPEGRAARFISLQLHETTHDRLVWGMRQHRDKAIAGVPEWERLRTLASQIKGRGEYAMVGQPGQFPIANQWQRMVARYVAKTYPNMHLDGTVEGSDVTGQPEPQIVEDYIERRFGTAAVVAP